MFKWIYELQKKLQEKISEKGQGMTEYAIILAVVAVVAIAVFYGTGGDGSNGRLANTISNAYGKANNQINAIGKTQSGQG